MSGTGKNSEDVRIVPTGACVDCGGRCVIRPHVKHGVVIRLESDTGEEPQLRACARGRALRKRVYHPNRLKYPLKRVGKRGEGKFERISWEEAFKSVASELLRVKEQHGSASVLFYGYGGSPGLFHGSMTVYKFLRHLGEITTIWGGASAEGAVFGSRSVYGTLKTGNTLDHLVHSRLIVLWGWNPAATVFGTNSSYYLIQAKEAGARILCIDPRFTETAGVLADQWIPIRPGTDTALMVAMAHVMIAEKLHDRSFLDRFTIGFERFEAYVKGEEDGVPKTPAWAEAITDIPASVIEELGREYATSKPAALLLGFAPSRTAYGEQFVRNAATLSAMTGNIGVYGGGAGGFDRGPVGGQLPELPPTPGELDVPRRLRTKIHGAKTWDAIDKGRAGGYPADFKLLYVCCANPINQCLNTNKGIRALERLDTIVVHEQFMTATARYADIVLPANTIWERSDAARPWYHGPYYLYLNKVIDSMYESKSDYEICLGLAKRLGITAFPDEDEEALVKRLVMTSDMAANIPDFERFKREGVVKLHHSKPLLSLKEQINDPENHPFPTPSGKIEIYSERIEALKNSRLPSIPKYIEPWEGPNDPLAKSYPLQLITTHFKTRAHSCFENVSWLNRLEPHTVWIHTRDAETRGISDGDDVKVFNDRGEIVLPATVTERIMPGVVAIGEGAWYAPDEQGVDQGGCVNVLTRDEYSPGGAWTTNTNLVQVSKI